MREVLQNALDARRAQDAPVKVTLSYRELDPSGRKYVDSVVPREHLDRYVQSVPHSYQNVAPITDCLVVEDFGTTGLTGVYDDPDKDGAGQNWNAFWFREGEGGKEGGTGNGGAGQGKITYFSTSGLNHLLLHDTPRRWQGGDLWCQLVLAGLCLRGRRPQVEARRVLGDVA